MGRLDEARNVITPDPGEAARELAVFADQLLPELENVHCFPPLAAVFAAMSNFCRFFV